MFKICGIGGYCENFIENCLNYIKQQSYTNWSMVCMIDPCDSALEIAKKQESDKIKVYGNINRKYAIENIVNGIKLLECNDEDIIIIMDLDDYLINPKALEIVYKYYANNSELLVTVGSYIDSRNLNNIEVKKGKFKKIAYTESDFIKGIRNIGHKFTVLRTFKYKIWKNIKEEDLKDNSGCYAKYAYDHYIGFPLVEMAGSNRIEFINEILYQYNVHSKIGARGHRKDEQEDAIIARSKKPYNIINF